VLALGHRIRIGEILTDRGERRTRIVQHHVDRRVVAGRADLGDLIDRQHRVEGDVGVVRGLAEGRHQHCPVRFFPAAGEGREDEPAGLRETHLRKDLHRAERETGLQHSTPI
jgi:hypothetical protein